MIKEIVSKFDFNERLAITGYVFLACIVMFVMCGCANLKEKSVAGEVKVYGMDAEVPSVDGSSSFAKIRLGVVTTRWITAPEGGKASINTKYNDINIWSLSGSAESTLTVENNIKPIAIDSRALMQGIQQ